MALTFLLIFFTVYIFAAFAFTFFRGNFYDRYVPKEAAPGLGANQGHVFCWSRTYTFLLVVFDPLVLGLGLVVLELGLGS